MHEIEDQLDGDLETLKKEGRKTGRSGDVFVKWSDQTIGEIADLE